MKELSEFDKECFQRAIDTAKETWPEIIHIPFTDEPKDLMIDYFHSEIKKGNTKWPEKMLSLLGEK